MVSSQENIIRIYDKYLVDERAFVPFRTQISKIFGEPLPDYIVHRQIKCEGQGRLLGAMFAPIVADSFGITRFPIRQALMHGALLGRAWRVYSDDLLDHDSRVAPPPEITNIQDYLLEQARDTLLTVVPEEWHNSYAWHFDHLATITRNADLLEQKLRRSPLEHLDADQLPDVMGLKIALTGWIPEAALHYIDPADLDVQFDSLRSFMTALNAAIQLNHDLLDVKEDWEHKHITFPTLLAARRFGVELGTGDIYEYAYHPDVLKPVIDRLRRYMATCHRQGNAVFPYKHLVYHCQMMDIRYRSLLTNSPLSVQQIRAALAANQGHPTENRIKV